MKSEKIMYLKISIAMALLGQAPETRAEDPVVAKIGSREIFAADIKPQLENLGPAERKALLADRDQLARFVRSALLRDAVLAEARGAGWDKNPRSLAALDRLRDQYIVESYLVEVGKVPEGFPSEEELKQAYDAEKERLRMPRRYRLSQIFIAAGPDKKAAGTRAQELRASLEEEPAEFVAMAKRNSNDAASAARGGDLGWLAADEIRPAIRSAVAPLGKGQISPPVEEPEGFHIVRVDEVREAGPASFEEVREQLAVALRNRRAALNRESYLAGLLAKEPVSVNELALESLQ